MAFCGEDSGRPNVRERGSPERSAGFDEVRKCEATGNALSNDGLPVIEAPGWAKSLTNTMKGLRIRSVEFSHRAVLTKDPAGFWRLGSFGRETGVDPRVKALAGEANESVPDPRPDDQASLCCQPPAILNAPNDLFGSALRSALRCRLRPRGASFAVVFLTSSSSSVAGSRAAGEGHGPEKRIWTGLSGENDADAACG